MKQILFFPSKNGKSCWEKIEQRKMAGSAEHVFLLAKKLGKVNIGSKNSVSVNYPSWTFASLLTSSASSDPFPNLDMGDTETLNESSGSDPNPSTSESGAQAKLYKTTLCQFYLQGPCKNGESCPFAHGTSELRTRRGGTSVKELEASLDHGQKHLKTKLCEKFLQFGSCPFGPSCNFAHGVKEVQQAVANFSPPGTNPNFKTVLCNSYMNGHYCPFAEKCQYAHGHHELRQKGSVDANDIPEQMKQKLSINNQNKNEYKTKLCKNFKEMGICNYGESCLFAHGEDQLRTGGANHSNQQDYSPHGGSKYKTTLCKNGPQCTYGNKCQFAHNASELRVIYSTPLQPTNNNIGPNRCVQSATFKTTLCKNFVNSGSCHFGFSCQFAHGQHELRPFGGETFKTKLCQSVSLGMPCAKGTLCTFAHNPMELRNPIDPLQFQHKGRFKTIMCKNMIDQGNCSHANNCNFAHSFMELKEAQANDPKYKTALCENFKAGTCEKGNECIFAHGEAELRSSSTYPNSQSNSAFAPGSNFFSHLNGFTYQQQNPKYKTILCKQFMENGACERKESCTFAHGDQELKNGDTYKTEMCKNHSDDKTCPKGLICHYAHSAQELRASNGTNGVKRKIKTVLCQNWQTFGDCHNGAMCTYAHGEEELQSTKRPKHSE